MGMVEFIALVAEDLSIAPEVIENSVAGRFGTVMELALALEAAGLSHGKSPAVLPGSAASLQTSRSTAKQPITPSAWLASTAVRLPDQIESAAQINEALHRPADWLERHAGILQRRVWGEQDPLAAAAEAGRECCATASVPVKEIGALLVTSEAPPLVTGLGAALHHRLELSPGVPALEVGGACTGTLAAFWAAQALLHCVKAVLVIAVEAPTRYLSLAPGPAGEAAALFGDGAAAALLVAQPTTPAAVPLMEIWLGCDGRQQRLIRVTPSELGQFQLHLDAGPLASQAIQTMARSVESLAQKYGLKVAELHAVVTHGGNGRLPGLLARKLGLSAERMWSETARTGNLGSASLPVAWSAHQPVSSGPVVWTAVGAGLTWVAALLGTVT
jgi:3-oxoacyl-[acyl-carrier-protein] synthase-3